MSEENVLEIEERPGLRILYLNRPRRKNALDVPLATALCVAIEEADSSEAVRAIVVTGRGDAFTAGADVSLFAAPSITVGSGQRNPSAIYQVLMSCRTPVIAAVNGVAVGMGVTLLPHFDLVYASEDASFMTPFVKLGLCAEFGSSRTLFQLLGKFRASELILRGRAIDARTAASWGLVGRVFPGEQFMDEVLAVADDLAALPPGTMQKNKELINAWEREALNAQIAEEMKVLAGCLGSDENRAAAVAFLKKRGGRS